MDHNENRMENTPAPQQSVQAPEPILCVNMCGFFGSSQTGNMCSKCYKETIELAKKENAEAPTVPNTPSNDEAAQDAAFVSAITAAASSLPSTSDESAFNAALLDGATSTGDVSASKSTAATTVITPFVSGAASASTAVADEQQPELPQEPEKAVQTKKNRCWDCNKKVGLLGHECRCGYIFCAAHRYAEDHNCSFDFKENGRKQLAEQNPHVVAPKIQKI